MLRLLFTWLRGMIIAYMRRRRSDQHRRPFHQLVMRLGPRMPCAQWSVEAACRRPAGARHTGKLCAIGRFVDIQARGRPDGAADRACARVGAGRTWRLARARLRTGWGCVYPAGGRLPARFPGWWFMGQT